MKPDRLAISRNSGRIKKEGCGETMAPAQFSIREHSQNLEGYHGAKVKVMAPPLWRHETFWRIRVQLYCAGGPAGRPGVAGAVLFAGGLLLSVLPVLSGPSSPHAVKASRAARGRIIRSRMVVSSLGGVQLPGWAEVHGRACC